MNIKDASVATREGQNFPICLVGCTLRCMPQSLLNKWNTLDTKLCICQKKSNVSHDPKLMVLVTILNTLPINSMSGWG